MATHSLAELADKLFCAVISDCLDQAGIWKQAFPTRIRPLDESLVMVGRARTALYMDVYAETPGENPYELEIALIDSLKPGEIPVFSCGMTGRVAPWGELLSTASKYRGAAGAVMDGCVRDIKAIRQMKFPVFHGGIARWIPRAVAPARRSTCRSNALASPSAPATWSSATPTASSWSRRRMRTRC